MSVSFSGELAFEIHIPNAQLYSAYLALREAGKAHDMKLFGSRAVEAMRLEKGYLHWKADILTEFDPLETGLDRFVKMDKADFVGKTALQARIAAGPKRKLVTLDVDCKDRPAHGGASVMQNGSVVGTVTSGGWGHRVNKNLAYAFITPDTDSNADDLTIDMLGDLIRCKIIPTGPYDPDNAIPRS